MNKETVSGIVLTMLLMGILTSAFNIQLVSASYLIYIRSDGSVDPSTAPIQRDGNLYTFTGDIYDCYGVQVEGDNIIIDGNGRLLQGVGTGSGFQLYNKSNVTLRNTNIESFGFGILLLSSSQILITGNNITDSWVGIRLAEASTNNNITTNSILKCYSASVEIIGSNRIGISQNYVASNIYDGIGVFQSSDVIISRNTIATNGRFGILFGMMTENNTIVNNNITNNLQGIRLEGFTNINMITRNNVANNTSGGIVLVGLFTTWKSISRIWLPDNNAIRQNSITKNSYVGIWLDAINNFIGRNDIANSNYAIMLAFDCSSNRIFHNNFLNNTNQVGIWICYGSNVWDDGYPSGGNYWSDYKERYPDAEELDDSGIWDTPYVIDEGNQDNYPLMEPWMHVPPAKDTDAYIEYVNGTMQDLAEGIFNRTAEDVPDIKTDFSDLFNDTLENINEGNYVGAIEKLNRIKQKIHEEILECAERQELIALIDDLIAYLATLL